MDKILKRKDVTGNLKDMACGCQLDPKRGRVSQPFECAPVVDAGTDGAADLRAVRIISEEELAAPLPCFKEGISACRREKGFRKALSDPHLAVVVPAPVAAALNGFRHGPVEAPATPVQGCAVTVDNTRGTFELGKQWDGYVARAMLYAAKHYNVRTRLLPGELQQISNQHPPTPQERLMSMEGAAFGVPQALIDEFATQ